MKIETGSMPSTTERVTDFLALTKPRLNSLVVITTAVSFYLANVGPLDLLILLHTTVGVALIAGGAAALNQVAERDLDSIMERTRHRPLPTGRVKPVEGKIFGAVLVAIGTSELALATNWLATTIALITLVSYVGVYTPLKRLTPWSTLVGAVPGALPPMIGWTAARGSLEPAAWVLSGIVFFWQLPHFHALAWMYLKDFKRANIPIVAVLDQTGRRTSAHALAYTVVLFPVSLAPSLVGLSGRLYIVGTVVAGIGLFTLAMHFTLQQTTDRARRLFFGSLIYLPVLWSLLVIERVF